MASRGDTVKINRVVPRIEAPYTEGLTSAQAKERLDNGYGNVYVEPPTKTIGSIFRTNIFTYFNMIFFILALLVIMVGSYRDLTFIAVVAANTIIGIVQEIRSKRTLDKMNMLDEPKATVIRDGVETEVAADEAVLDDIAVFGAGVQIYADAIVLSGECQVNEALVTGEADEVMKKPGDILMSGSFIISGKCIARLDKVGEDSFVSKLTMEAKESGKRKRSEMMESLTKLVKVIGIVIIPLGVILYLNHTVVLNDTVKTSVLSTVAALIGMIPEGLYLLVSVALTVSVMRLARKRTLCHDLSSVETLARVNVLCVDKTGTITENKMTVKDIVPLCEDRFNEDDIRMIMSDYVGNMRDDNDTMLALRRFFTGEVRRRAAKVLPFSSQRKYGAASFQHGETYVLGAPELILEEQYEKYKEIADEYSAMGCRVLLLALYDGGVDDGMAGGDILALAFILLTNKIREEAPKTFRFFEKEGVRIKVISGDNPVTVSSVAVEAGIENAELYVDATTLTTERKIKRAINDYVVFGRVTPEQKRKLVRAMKEAGYTVAMTGDGVNDVLALKDADCSIAMASGSEVARQVSQLVLMNSNFSAMPSVVMEGRRVINNIQRSASLFLVKNIFSFTLAIITLIFALNYPLLPSQMALYNIMTIGIPSFVLALEPNTSIVTGRFMWNVLSRAIPAGLTDVIVVVSAIFLCRHFSIPFEEMSTICAYLISIVGFMMLYGISRPLNLVRKALIVTVVIGFVLGSIFLGDYFTLAPLGWGSIGITALLSVAAVPIMILLAMIIRRIDRGRSGEKRYASAK